MNEAQICPKFKNQLRAIDDCAVINTAWAEKKIQTVIHSVKSISVIDTMETRTISRTISQHLSKT